MNKLLIGSVITPDDITMYGLTPSKQINIVEGTLSSWRNVLRGIGQLPDYAKSDQSLAIYISNYNPVDINFLVQYVNVAHFKTDLNIQYIKNYKLSEQEFFEYRRRFPNLHWILEKSMQSGRPNITRRFSLRAHAHNNHICLNPDKLFYDIVMVNRKVINNISIEYSLRKEC